jgi:hypothetical protein
MAKDVDGSPLLGTIYGGRSGWFLCRPAHLGTLLVQYFSPSKKKILMHVSLCMFSTEFFPKVTL